MPLVKLVAIVAIGLSDTFYTTHGRDIVYVSNEAHLFYIRPQPRHPSRF